MAVHFHPLQVKEVKKETADCVSVSFHVPPALAHEFQFIQGQNITIKATIDGVELRRSYSICAAPFENELRIAIKKMEGGKFSDYANTALQKGDVLAVMPPTGKFNTALLPGNKKKYVAFAAGSGITPIISIIKATLQTEADSQFTLVYGNRTKTAIVFFEELEALKNTYLQRFNFIHLLSREKTEAPINSGKIDAEKLQALATLINYKNTDEFFVCGPGAMIASVTGFLKGQDVSATKIHFELFTAPGQPATAVKAIRITDDAPKSNITIQLDGRTITFNLAFDTDSILDAALQQGADLPFACKGGVCATCRSKLIAGQVSMSANYALEAEELASGFILTCQSRPLTASVSIDFDVK